MAKGWRAPHCLVENPEYYIDASQHRVTEYSYSAFEAEPPLSALCIRDAVEDVLIVALLPYATHL